MPTPERHFWEESGTPKDASQILAQQAAIYRSQKARTLAQKQQLDASRTMYSAVILGFDADVGLYKCKLVDGRVVLARSIASSGGKGIGDVVSLYKNSGINLIKWL